MFHGTALKFTALAAVTLAATLFPQASQAEYPEKPITLVVGFSAGGGTDTYARTLGGLIHEILGMPMVVINKPGAAGMIAAKFVKERSADGYTLYMASAGSFLVKYLYDTKAAPASPLDDFRLLGMAGASIPGLLVPAKSRFKTAADLVSYAKKHPGDLRWSHPGRGSLFQLTGEAFLKSNGMKAQDVPFKGGSRARNSIAGKQVDFGFMGIQLYRGFESKIRALGVAGEKRDPANKKILTFQEQGLPSVKLINPQIVMAPKGLSDGKAAKLTAAIKAVVAKKAFRKILGKAGLSARFMSPAKSRALLVNLKKQLSPIISRTRGK